MSNAEKIVADAQWFPLRFDTQREEFHFALIPPRVHREIAFLKDAPVTSGNARVVSLADIRERQLEASKLHLILHSGLGGSTLLARALSQPGVCTSLQEPPILTDLIAYSLAHSWNETSRLLDQVTRLLSRPLAPGEVVVCKMNSVSNGLGIPMASVHPGSQILCLDTPLEEMLTSFISRGSEGRLAARKLLVGIRNSRMLPFQLSDAELIEHTDLQLCALAWLSMRNAMVDAAGSLGSQRVGSITSRQLMEETHDALTTIAKHFGLRLDVDERLVSGIFNRHSKTGQPFDAKRRAERVIEILHVHRSEIEPIVAWTRKVADATGIAWDLPYPLLS